MKHFDQSRSIHSENVIAYFRAEVNMERWQAVLFFVGFGLLLSGILGTLLDIKKSFSRIERQLWSHFEKIEEKLTSIQWHAEQLRENYEEHHPRMEDSDK